MILFSAISKGSLILCDYTESNEDLYSLIQKQLKFIKNNEQNQQFQINNTYTIIILQKQEYNFICVLSYNEQIQQQEQQVKLAYQFLTEIQEEFQLMNNQSDFDKGQFSKVIAAKINMYKVQTIKFENIIENNPEEIQNQFEVKQQYQIKEIKPLINTIEQSYKVFTCKSLFFVFNLILAGLLVEIFAKFKKYL